MGYSIFETTIADQTWQDLEALAKPETIVLFPLGVIEEHGPHLPLAVDCYTSLLTAAKVKEIIEADGKHCVLLPPYYWGINKVTGGFPGSFTVRPETMKAVLCDLLHCLKTWGFQHIYCFNCHGDPLHIQTILESIRTARAEDKLNARLIVEDYMPPIYNLDPTDPALLIVSPEYPEEQPDSSQAPTGYDLHAGAYETAYMNHYFPTLTNTSLAHELKDTSLQEKDLSTWNEGGQSMRHLLPLGYAGNPAGFDQFKDLAQIDHIFNLCAAKKIIENSQEQQDC